VLRDGLRPVVLGTIAGCLGAIAVARAMQALLYGVAPFDALSFVGATIVLLGASVVAALLPARRAARLDPLQSLRTE
jgi:ABC-type antimicrobial peptide transport system permease subunit